MSSSLQLIISNNNKSNNGSSNLKLSSSQISTCNHCFRGKDKKNEETSVAPVAPNIAPVKVDSTSSLTSTVSPIPENSSTRQSILLLNNVDMKKRFMLSSTSQSSLNRPADIEDDEIKLEPVKSHNPFRHHLINKNKSCSKHETCDYISCLVGNMSEIHRKEKKYSLKKFNFIKMQKSNNAPNIKDHLKCQQFRWSLGYKKTYEENSPSNCTENRFSAKHNMKHFDTENLGDFMTSSNPLEHKPIPIDGDDIIKNISKTDTRNSPLDLPAETVLPGQLPENKIEDMTEIDNTRIFIERFKELKSQKRYIFVKDLGEGAYGYVLECLDSQKKKLPVAIKVSKNMIKSSKKLFDEVLILKKIIDKFDSPHNPCATLMQWFKLENRLCLVFQRYGDNLFAFMKKRQFRPLPIEQILQIAYQLLTATLFLHEECDLIHTDLKPENVVLCSPVYIIKEGRGAEINMIPSKLDIKIIDFGNALLNKGKTYRKMIGTRHYRAVEVILGYPWNYRVDYWSVGCIFYELYTGKVLFMAKNDSHHLAFIDRIIGPINVEMTKTSKKAHLFLRNGKFNKTALDDYHAVERKDSLENHLKQSSCKSQLFSSLIIDFLKIDPKSRPDIKEVLQSYLFAKVPDYLKRRFKHFVFKSSDVSQTASII